MKTNNVNVDSEKLSDFTSRAFRKLGVPEEDARIAAKILIATDLRGIDSHGVARLAAYLKGLKEGRINPVAKTEVSSRALSTAVMDGGKGLGFIVGHRAMMEAIRRAEKTGAGFVTVRNSNHFGAGGNYAIMALPYNMIGISMTVGGKGMAAPGGSGGGVGINVISIAAPTQEEAPFVLDMATTVVAAGKLEIALREGKTIPEGWAVDDEGKPITEPEKFFKEHGALLPLGGTLATGSHKGFGLAIVVDILCSVLSGSLANAKTMGNHFFGALRIDGFLPAENFKKAMDEMIKEYRALPKIKGVERIYIAGEIEQEIEKQRRRDGIPLNHRVIESLQEIARELDIEYNL